LAPPFPPDGENPVRHIALLALATAACQAAAAEPFELRDGDRVVLLGGTLIEREPSYGYVETALTAAHPDKAITFRNLGWSGDTVTGIARARFGPPEEGYQHLKEHVIALKPTVLIIAYGMNESFEGADGLPAFRKDLARLLDTLEETKARIVLLSPNRHEDLGRPLPDPARHNRDLALYRDLLREVAVERGHAFLDLYAMNVGDGMHTEPPAPQTEDGITLSPHGYWSLSTRLRQGDWIVRLGSPNDDTLSIGTRVSDFVRKDDHLHFRAHDARLPLCEPPPGSPAVVDRVLNVRGLKPGQYALTVDGTEVARSTAEGWAKGVWLKDGPERDQSEALRRAIIKKNLLYFHRWRPQNETYLFGFRKHEQGQNAREVPLFDPLVAEQEEIIARLKLPVPRVYELSPIAEAAR
jgi:lysophospholipase L1-like esterase